MALNYLNSKFYYDNNNNVEMIKPGWDWKQI